MGKYLGAAVDAAEVHGVDVVPQFVEAARQRGLITTLGDINTGQLAYPDGYFDAIFAGEVFEHAVDPDRFLDELYRLLAPGGACIITTPNLVNWLNRIAVPLGWTPFFLDTGARRLYGRPRWTAPSDLHAAGHSRHLSVITTTALRAMVIDHGFTVFGSLPEYIEGDVLPAERDRGPLSRRLMTQIVRRVDRYLSSYETLATGIVLGITRAPHR